jgi:hypothetical protein
LALNFLHTISGLLVVILFVIKVVLHYYIAYKNNSATNFLYSLSAPLEYFGFYRKMVPENFLKIKQICNRLLSATLISLIVNLLLGLAIYFK